MADDDCMILDSGDEVFLWFGSQASHVEKKLTFKSAQVFALSRSHCVSLLSPDNRKIIYRFPPNTGPLGRTV